MKRFVAHTAALSIVLGCAQSDSESPPKRPTTVPALATWAGGPEGGSWINCDKGNSSGNYECQVYEDTSGAIWAAGTFLARKSTWNPQLEKTEYSEPNEYVPLEYNFFDGVIIHLKSPFVLVPHGVIDFPFGDGHGKRQEYVVGEPKGPEEQY